MTNTWMPIEDRVRIIIETEAADSLRPGRTLEYMEGFIKFHFNDALRENREAIAKMVGTWHEHGQGGYCVEVYQEIAKAILEGKTCIHKWTDMRNKYIESGEVCLKCGTVRAGNEATGHATGIGEMNHGANVG